MASLAVAEHEARQEEIEQAPTQRSDAAGAASKVGRLRRKKKEVEVSLLPNVEDEIRALEVVLRREREKAADARLVEAIKQAGPPAEARDDLDTEHRPAIAGRDAELQNRYVQAMRARIEPFPQDFPALLEGSCRSRSTSTARGSASCPANTSSRRGGRTTLAGCRS